MSVRAVLVQDVGNGWLSALVEFPGGKRMNAEVVPTENGEHNLSNAQNFPEQDRCEIVEAVVKKAKEDKLI